MKKKNVHIAKGKFTAVKELDFVDAPPARARTYLPIYTYIYTRSYDTVCPRALRRNRKYYIGMNGVPESTNDDDTKV